MSQRGRGNLKGNHPRQRFYRYFLCCSSIFTGDEMTKIRFIYPKNKMPEDWWTQPMALHFDRKEPEPGGDWNHARLVIEIEGVEQKILGNFLPSQAYHLGQWLVNEFKDDEAARIEKEKAEANGR
jgi:hypothetical protein